MNVRRLPATVLAALFLWAACGHGQDALLVPPRARVAAHVREVHGDRFVDDYFWLRERDNPEVQAYLNAENEYTEAAARPTQALRERLFAEMKSRLKEDDQSPPYLQGGYWHYSRNVPGQQYRVYCRKKGTLDADEEVVLDENALAAGHEYFSLGAYEFSPDQLLLAYSTDLDGSEEYRVRVKDLRTGALFEDTIEKTAGSAEWANDGRTLFYTTLDEAHRPFKVWRHRLGESADKDVLVHHETDERFFVSLDKTRSQKFLLVELASQVTTEVRFLDADRPTEALRVVQPRSQGMEYAVDHQGDRFFIVTNDGAVNFRVAWAPVSKPGKEHWAEFLPYEPAVKVDAVEAFEGHLAIEERRGGQQSLRVVDLTSEKGETVAFDEPARSVSLTQNREFRTRKLRFRYESLTTPGSTFDYDMVDGTRTLKKRDEVPGYDGSKYETVQELVASEGGVRIPVSMVMLKGLPRDGKRPLLLYGYGSYGASMDPWFSSARVSLLDRGVIFAIAHVRGGGEMGRPWYEDGKLLQKKNTFGDFIACAEHLISRKYTDSRHLAIMGGSAGGLLVGAVVNMRPELFHCAVAQVPFVDVMNTMLDPTIPLTVTEYEEWGNPADKSYYDYMRSYSPYDNVRAAAYPHLLITAGLNDPRVQYWEPAKWAARLRALKTGDRTLMLKTNMGAGHAGESGRYGHLEETAFEFAFVLDKLGVGETP